jgi:thiamine biosynthesis protein ThiI
MEGIILLKQGEIVLKGLNRRAFEQKLIANVRRRLKPFGDFNVYSVQSTVYVEPRGGADMDGAYDAAKTVFGVVAVSRAAACEKDNDRSSRRAALSGDRLDSAKSFKVETKRADKSFPMTSIELSQYVGGLLAEEFPHVRVDVRHPEYTVNLEVRDYAAYVHGPS